MTQDFTKLVPAPMVTFSAFYRAINKRDPFPWQRRLARLVADREEWPSEIGIPTGLGKTACLDIAIWWLASQAHRPPQNRTAPTRIWWVVNRRLLVDSTAEHAESIATALKDASVNGHSTSSLHASSQGETSRVLGNIAKRLSVLSAVSTNSPLDVIRLRGGVASRTPTDPSRPTVILCTLPMYGSRLLFRGYGSKRRAVDAAMAGTDSLVLLDEAHLAPHLVSLVPALGSCTPGAETILGKVRTKPILVPLTATGEVDKLGRFDLDSDDEANPVVRQRLDAAKPIEVRIAPGNSNAIPKILAGVALEVIGASTTYSSCLVFANTPRTARLTFNILCKKMTKIPSDILLLTGLSREREATRIRSMIVDSVTGMGASQTVVTSRNRHLIVVATQTLEVGADLDAEYLITEACGVRALTQRLGRLNRLGLFSHAQGIYVHTPPKRDRWPVYGQEPRLVLERLQKVCRANGSGTVNLSPRQISEVLGAPDDAPRRAPEILPGILWEWMKTTTPPSGEAPVEPYFSGIAHPNYKCSVIWRTYVPKDGNRLWPRARDREAVDVPVSEVREALDGEEIARLRSDRVTIEDTTAASLRPGDQIVLPCDRGLLDEFGWNLRSSAPVVDVSLARRGLPLDSQAIRRLCGVDLGTVVSIARGEVTEGKEIGVDEQAEAASNVLHAVTTVATPLGWFQAEWRDLVDSLSTRVVKARKEIPRLSVNLPKFETVSEDLDETCLRTDFETLTRHGVAVGERVRAIADRIGLKAELADVAELAGVLHDTGKSDMRFQRWLDPNGESGSIVAKSKTPRHLWSSTRVAAGWPRGGRHEALSGRLVLAWLSLRSRPCNYPDLLVHLVISHHGRGRPLVPPVPDRTVASVVATIEGIDVEVSADLSIVDWEQPARFRRLSDRFGPWGLALLEAIVICSDHAVSSKAMVQTRRDRNA